MNIHISQLRWYNFHLVFEGRQLVKSFENSHVFSDAAGKSTKLAIDFPAMLDGRIGIHLEGS